MTFHFLDIESGSPQVFLLRSFKTDKVDPVSPAPISAELLKTKRTPRASIEKEDLTITVNLLYACTRFRKDYP